MREIPLWQEQAPMPEQNGTGGLPERADVAIVGGGYTGLGAARHLQQMGLSAVVSARLDSVLSVMVERHLDAVVITRSVSTGDKLAGIFTTTDACREFAATLARQYAIDGNSAA